MYVRGAVDTALNCMFPMAVWIGEQYVLVCILLLMNVCTFFLLTYQL